MNLLSRLKDKKALAPGLTVAGLAMILSKLLLKWLAPVTLASFGLYRFIMKKRYVEGALMVVGGILLWGLLSWRFVSALLSFMMLVGAVFFVTGTLLLIANKKNRSDL